MLRKFGIIAVLSLLVTALAAVPALAVAPTSVTQTGGVHVCQGSTLDVSAVTTDAGKALRTTGEVCGVGTSGTATLTSTAEFTVGCLTRGGGEPRGLQDVETDVVGEGALDVTRQGRGTFDLTTEAVTIPATFDCPSANQEEIIVGPITFTDITLTITSQTGTLTATFPDIDP